MTAARALMPVISDIHLSLPYASLPVYPPRLLLLIFRSVNALMVVWTVLGVSKKYKRGYSRTYWHLGRNAAAMIAPEAPSCLSLRSAAVMSTFIVTACLSPKMMLVNATATLVELYA